MIVTSAMARAYGTYTFHYSPRVMSGGYRLRTYPRVAPARAGGAEVLRRTPRPAPPGRPIVRRTKIGIFAPRQPEARLTMIAGDHHA